MTAELAQQVAGLINARNKLVRKYTAQRVLEAAGNYLCRVGSDSRLIGVVEVKRVQWYQCEIDHLSVRADCGRQGIGFSLVEEAEARAVQLGARVAQCTIRSGNGESERLFRKRGYVPGATFFNVDSGNQVTVYQKALVTQ
jgi:ribosomal protein S18 acetylase RimI-like enzyme